MTETASLSERLALLEDREALRDLMQRYARAADAKYTADHTRRDAGEVARAAADQAACFTEDAEWTVSGFGGALKGRGEIAAFFETSPWDYTLHHYVCPEIALDGDTAQVRWRLIELGCPEKSERVVLLTGVVEQTCRRTPQGWRIASMSFEVLQEVELADNRDAITCLVPRKGQAA
ncbi:nuclear transport factor 2 family protein [Roseovarius sp. SYSU LYC5161]|uniref:nuclear transport factor 2 family protein n=1 Tax=Roseovarius halophilus (ex Wu et al. 2025) TaxID=3376060 RepID=UPI0039999DDF